MTTLQYNMFPSQQFRDVEFTSPQFRDIGFPSRQNQSIKFPLQKVNDKSLSKSSKTMTKKDLEDLIIIQKRPQSIDEYIRNFYDERTLISGKKKPNEKKEKSKRRHGTITQEELWLLNQRQGDDVGRVAERNASIFTREEKGKDDYRKELGEEGEFSRLLDYAENQKEETHDSEYGNNGIYWPVFNIGTIYKSQPAEMKKIPKISLSDFPSNNDYYKNAKIKLNTKVKPKGMLKTIPEVGMSESILQMNVPKVLQNYKGINSKWMC